MRTAGGTAKGKVPAGAPDSPATGGLAYGKALGRLKADGQAVTRGATETRVYAQASPAVVMVVAKNGFGSGVLIGADGKIVTNLHVVEDATEVGVVFKPAVEGAALSNADVRRARILRRDEVADLALIQVDEVPAGVKPLAIGNSTTVQVGADVHAIGHPTGEAWTYTRGIVSQIRRAYAWSTEDKIPHEATVIQTQTPINPGNSGGPLLDDELNVIGINSFVGEGEGLNFAVSAEDVKSFLARTQDRVSRPAARAVAETCERQVLEEGRTDDPKGKEFLVDDNCDGEADFLLMIPDSKRSPVVVLFDDDGDGKYDTGFYDHGHDGQYDVALYDTDADGEPDMRGDFRKGEDEPYRWEKIKK
ncbi:S1C family serine protease [Phenylobacterium sp. CCH9-H3]|uniref:S1C family serine protease n=1 Tax=Phenylobacterium sp. CCH9-H3 TaxID=1768774 RepID=UPI00083A725F|nr:S1C family serine protease [Phenylobacterium sp. CCH9-H3]